MLNRILSATVGACGLALLASCGGGGSSGSMAGMTQTAQAAIVLSDNASEDWATIGVKVLSIALVPQGGGSNVTVYTAPTPAPSVNLVQLDQIGELLSSATIPAGTYSGAVIVIAANPGDVVLTAAADPHTGFAGTPGASVSAPDVQVQNTSGTAPNMTATIDVSLGKSLTISTGSTQIVDLEFDLSHPAFLIGHVPPGAGATLWAVDFHGPVHHLPVHDLTRLVLRHSYGDVTAVASDNTSITINKDLPTIPVVSPETPVSTGHTLQILADASNGTLFYDMDVHTRTTIKDFSAQAATLVGRFVRVAARYQSNGTLVATRIWAGNAFDTVWLSPEGHVLHVNMLQNVLTVSNESGGFDRVTVDANTNFYFRVPQNALSDSTPVGTGTAFLANLARGFKVHVTPVDVHATPLVAQAIDIETAAFSGRISNATSASFDYTHVFRTPSDNYNVTLDYISPATPNGQDANGNALTGFKWWNFAYPTLITDGTNAVADFVTTVTGSVNFGGVIGPVSAWGESFAVWGDGANPSGWAAPWAVLVPTPMPLGAVAGTLTVGNTFTMSVLGGTNTPIVDVGTTSGSATLVYQVDRSNGVMTVNPVDVTTSAGLTTLTNGLVVGTPVKVYGVPQVDGTLKAYAITYFTGDQPTM